MNGKNSAFPLMDLLMGFIKSPFTFPIMCFWKIFLCEVREGQVPQVAKGKKK